MDSVNLSAHYSGIGIRVNTLYSETESLMKIHVTLHPICQINCKMKGPLVFAPASVI